MTQAAQGSRAKASRRNGHGDALFAVAREERAASDLRFLGDLSGPASAPLADVLRQMMRRGPAMLHFDLREITRVDAEGLQHLARAVRIGRRHGAMVKLSASRPVREAVEAAGLGAALGVLPTSVHGDGREDEERPNGSRGPSARF